MSIIYAAVVRPELEGRNVLLVEYMDNRRPNLKTAVFRDVLSQVGATSSIAFEVYPADRYNAAVAVRVKPEVTLIFVVVAKLAMTDDRLRDMLLKMQAQVSARPDLQYKTATQEGLRLHVELRLQQLVEKVNVEQAGDNSVEKVQLEAEETLEVLKDVSGKVLNRGEKLSDLLARADDLDDTAISFRIDAGRLERQTLWNLYKWQFICGGFASVLGGLFLYRLIRK